MTELKTMNRRMLAACVAALLLFSAGVLCLGRASAYLTSHARTYGYASLNLNNTRTDLYDDVANWEKHVAIKNTGDGDCQVRVKFFVAAKYAGYITYHSDDAGWSQNSDGYWYYDGILKPGESTPELLATLDSQKFSHDFTVDGSEDFNVIVVHEYARVQYDAAGQGHVDWNEKVDVN